MAKAKYNTLSPQLFFWLPSLYIVLHTIEELPYFGVWVTAHFGTHTTFVFALTHIPILLSVFLSSHMASKIGKNSSWVVLITAWQIQFGINAIFHIATSVLFREYSPGMVVAGSLGFVTTYYFISRIWREDRLSAKELSYSAILGAAMAAAAIGVLFID